MLALAFAPTLAPTPVIEPRVATQTPANANTSVNSSRLRAQIEALEQLLPHATDRGAVLFLLARRHAQLGELEQALSQLDACIALHEGFDPEAVAAFQPLASVEKYRALLKQAHA